ncbi:DNA-processing protein DprA [Glaciecola petra]|uniref:DNA-processing protein DprA n=1 Tax=Glaciecola petra TaxID=3075602 RepID=A0ABU2ZTQ0_9ALTE|nr:DNA-processing protein DprA [Aestuariibacter sp. P117]MDT0594787.1 DNA-processing protein DprA [Aestuariibacter sp. P117]
MQHSTSISVESQCARFLYLASVPKLGIVSLLKSAEQLNCDLSQLCEQSKQNLLKVGWNQTQIKALKTPNYSIDKQVRSSLHWLAQSVLHHFISFDSPYYPNRLRQISRPPLFLFAVGDVNLLCWPQIAFVGSRSPSIYGVQSCHTLIQQLACFDNIGTISGLALGIDAACHKASLANNLPTIAVLGCGVDIIYPKRHADLYQQIRDTGLILSEFPLGTKPMAQFFPRRNRIISGLSMGVVVVEAKLKSGSLVTAKYALEQNREVFALPNNINNPNAEGCHWLIKQGAMLVECADDIVTELMHMSGFNDVTIADKKNEKKTNSCLASELLLDSVDYSATSVDTIAQRSGMSLSDVLTQLLEYELRGLVASTAEGYIKLGA